jgi:UDP-2-acetamido-3-amino-2,3-dideoxy-glucuronate N-acetyltransferase
MTDTDCGYRVHESSYVDDDVQIGHGTQIWHFCHVMSGSRIGVECRIGQNVVIGPHAVLGNNVKIQNNVSVYQGVILEDDVFCGPSIVFTNVTTPRSGIVRNTADDFSTTLVKRGATIGANATIVCGRIIGEYAFIGAGAVVTRDVPAYALVYGNPARQQGWACACGVKLKLEDDPPAGRRATCAHCCCGYHWTGERLEALDSTGHIGAA